MALNGKERRGLVKILTNVSADRWLSNLYFDVMTKSMAYLFLREQEDLFFVFPINVAVNEQAHG